MSSESSYTPSSSCSSSNSPISISHQLQDSRSATVCGVCPCCRLDTSHVLLHNRRLMLPVYEDDWQREGTFRNRSNTICANRVKCIGEFVVVRGWNGRTFDIHENKKRVAKCKEDHFSKSADNQTIMRCTDELSYKLLANELQTEDDTRTDRIERARLAREEHLGKMANPPRKFDARRNVELLWGEAGLIDTTKLDQATYLKRERVKRMLNFQDDTTRDAEYTKRAAAKRKKLKTTPPKKWKPPPPDGSDESSPSSPYTEFKLSQ